MFQIESNILENCYFRKWKKKSSEKNQKNFNYMENIYLQCTNLAGFHIRTKTCYFCTFSMSWLKALKVERTTIFQKWFLMDVQMTLSYIQTS